MTANALDRDRLAATMYNRTERFRQTEREHDEARTELIEITQVARKAGWSAQKIASQVGVTKRTIQVWTDHVR